VNTTLTEAGWVVEESVHSRHGMNLTNIEARWASPNSGGRQVVLAAHYDSRNIADKDLNETNQTLPVPGANDGGSGVAVVLELATIVPQLDLNYDIVLFLNDAEDQNQNFTAGAEAWAENLSEEDIENTEAFVLMDMVGDADLQLRNINPGNDTLKERMVHLAEGLGMVLDVEDCMGNPGEDIVQYDIEVGVLDDHYHAHVRNIPSIDLMDPQYGEPTPYSFGSLWHTMEDTPDKVSAASLEHVGRWVELGLRTDAFVNIAPSDESSVLSEEDAPKNPVTVEERTGGDGEPRLALLALGMLVGVVGALLVLEYGRRG
jgi:Zn-dependent M28 family amino/carboxypeptidase